MWDKEGVLVLVALGVANLFTYIARYIPSATKDLIKDDLGLTDMQTGLIFTVFICCYMVVSPIIGVVADHKWVKRKVLIVIGLVVLSVATLLTGLCHSFGLILLPRVLFGIGESVFCTISPTFLSDFFDPAQRNIVMSVFFGAIPIGCALGYTIAGALGQAYGWQRAFQFLAAPGILSFGLLFLREPEMGERDRISALASAKDRVRIEEEQNAAAAMAEQEPTSPTTTTVTETGATTTTTSAMKRMSCSSASERSETTTTKELHVQQEAATDRTSSASTTTTTTGNRNSGSEGQPLLGQGAEVGSTTILNGQFVVAVLGYIAVTFGMGGFSDWLPTFFTRYHGMSLSTAGLVNGAIVVVGGLFGTLLGGFAGEWTRAFVTERHPLLLFSGLTMVLSATAGLLALVEFQNTLIAVELMLGAAVFFGWCYNGPINAVVLNSVVARLRSRANGVCTLLIHLFGDAISPSIIGLVSDESGDLRSALLIVPLSLFVSALLWLGGFFTLPSDAPFCKSRCCRQGIKKIKKTAGIEDKVPPPGPPESVVTRGATPTLSQQADLEPHNKQAVSEGELDTDEQPPTAETTTTTVPAEAQREEAASNVLLATLPTDDEGSSAGGAAPTTPTE